MQSQDQTTQGNHPGYNWPIPTSRAARQAEIDFITQYHLNWLYQEIGRAVTRLLALAEAQAQPDPPSGERG